MFHSESQTKLVFVAWDRTIEHVQFLLENLQKHPDAGRVADEPKLDVDPLMLQEHGGDVGDLVLEAIEKADEVMAFLDRPNANVGFEVGYALGMGKPVSFVYHGGELPAWTCWEPFRGQLLRPVRSAHEARALLRGKRGGSIEVQSVPRDGDRTIVLCPSGARDARENLERHFESCSPVFEPLGSAFKKLAELLSGTRRFVWILAAYPKGQDERDGAENAALSALAGFLCAHEREMIVLRQKGLRGSEGEPCLHDFEVSTREWTSGAELVALLEEYSPRPSPPVEVEPGAALDAWREHLVRWNDRLVPFFGGVSSKTYGEVYVERQVAEEVDLEAPELGAARLEGRRPVALEELLRQGVAENPDNPGLWLVLGAPGAGKTTLLRRLCAKLAADVDGPVPTLLSLAHLAQTRGSLFDLAQRDLEGASGLASELARLAQEGRVWVFLDGLDEVRARDLLELPALLKDFHAQFHRCPLVLTSRDEGRRDLGLPFEPLRLLDLHGDEGPRLVEAWLPGRGEAIWSEIGRHPLLAQLARNPWMLTLMAKLASEGGALPHRRSELLEQAIELLLEHGTDGPETDGVAHGVRDPLAAADLLPALALRLHKEGGEAWPKKVLARHMRRCCHDEDYARDLKTAWDTPAAFLEDLGSHSGLLAPRRGPSQPWEFVHRSLRELLVARAWAEMPAAEAEPEYLGLVDELGRQAQDDDERGAQALGHWGEVLVLLAGRLEDPRRLRTLVERMRGLPGRLGLRALVEARALAPGEALELLFQGHWDGEDLLFLVRGWLERGEPSGSLALLLLSQLTLDTELDAAGRLHYALTETELADDARFFEAWGRRIVRAEDLGIEMRSIPGGSFRIGCEEGDPQAYPFEMPAHDVLLDPIELARTPVTEKEMAAWIGHDSSSRLPVVRITWYAARLFCRAIGCELPTEAQWEAACRAGTSTQYWSGDSEEDLDRVGWYDKNSGYELHPVGQKPAPAEHPFGLLDMHGNVWEWCDDSWHGSYEGAPPDGRAWSPTAPSSVSCAAGPSGTPRGTRAPRTASPRTRSTATATSVSVPPGHRNLPTSPLHHLPPQKARTSPRRSERARPSEEPSEAGPSEGAERAGEYQRDSPTERTQVEP